MSSDLIVSNLPILFPLAVALYALLWCFRWARIHRWTEKWEAEKTAGLPLSPAEAEASAPAEPEPERRFSRLDWLLLCLITAAYAVIAFLGLGDTTAPQSYLHFEEGNTYALIELAEPQTITGLRYWSGLNTADYRLQFSLDGESWTDQITAENVSGMTQKYTQLFRWNDAVLNGDTDPVRYVRIISGAEQYLGEVVLYGADGAPIPAEKLSPAAGCEALLDEQDTVPAAYSYMNGTYFDEIYHARTALEMIENMWPYEITHPPLGKAILSLGIRLFGMTPFGWRFMGVLFGVLMLPFLYLLLKRMFGYTSVAAAGTAVFAFDFMHFVQTRIATIDTYGVFFILLMYLFLFLWLSEPPEREKRRTLWLALSGVSFGMGAASKWVCLYAGAGLAVIWLVYWVRRALAAGWKAVLDEFLLNVGWCLIFFVLVPGFIYYASYWSYAPSQGITGPFRLFSKDYLKMVISNQTYMFNYHADLVATHPYASRWYQWLVDARPILYYLAYPASGLTSSFSAFNNPLVAWGGLAAMVGVGWCAVRDRDMTAQFILIGYLANLLPWTLISRLTFAYHYFPCTLFLALAIGYVFADLRRRDPHWQSAIGSFAGLTVLLFVVFYPVLSGLPRTAAYSRVFLKWFKDTWPF